MDIHFAGPMAHSEVCICAVGTSNHLITPRELSQSLQTARATDAKLKCQPRKAQGLSSHVSDKHPTQHKPEPLQCIVGAMPES